MSDQQKIGLLFPGQGSQYVGMGKDFYEHSEKAKEIYDKASKILGQDIAKLCFEDIDKKLNETLFTQVAMFTTTIAYFEVFQEKFQNLEMVHFLAGHSLGEYAALVASKTLDFETGLMLVQKRAEIMNDIAQKNPGKMAAIIGLERKIVEECCQQEKSLGIVEPVNFNTPLQIVISGEEKAVLKTMEQCKNKGGKCILLKVNGAFHSSLMKEAGEKLALVLNAINFFPVQIPIVSNVTGIATKNPDEIKKLLSLQIFSPVEWVKSINYIENQNINTFIEIGPGKVLNGLCSKIIEKAKIYNIEKFIDLEKITICLDKN
ncbi:MAG: ACP S-malonyltransferase [bacterium]